MPSAGRNAVNGKMPTLFNIDGVCLRRNAGNQREVGFGVSFRMTRRRLDTLTLWQS